jgi:hypothetical protein
VPAAVQDGDGTVRGGQSLDDARRGGHGNHLPDASPGRYRSAM